MKKRWLTLALALCLCLSLTPMTAAAAKEAYPVKGGNLYFDTGTGMITGCDSTVTEAVVPEKIQGVTVTGVDNDALSNAAALRKLVLPDTVSAFWNGYQLRNTSLQSFYLPRDLSFRTAKSLLQAWYMPYLRELTVSPDHPDVTERDGALYSPDGKTLLLCKPSLTMTEFRVPGGVEVIEDNAFDFCPVLERLSLPEGLRKIGEDLGESSDLVLDRLPSTLESVGAYNYFTVEGGVLTLPAALEELGENAFTAYDLDRIEVDPDSGAFTAVDGVLFNRAMTELICYPAGRQDASYTIPAGVETIAPSAFEEARNLKTLSIPDSVTLVGDYAFAWSGLTEITLPAGLETESEWEQGYLFTGCEDLTDFRVEEGNPCFRAIDGVLFSADGTRLLAYPAGRADTEYTIPAGMVEMNSRTFSYAGNLQAIHVAEGNQNLKERDGVLFSADGTRLLAYPAGRPQESYKIPERVILIENNAFDRVNSLRELTLPASLADVGGLPATSASGITAYRTAEGSPFRAVDGVLFSADGTRLIRYPCGRTDAAYTVPDGVTTLDERAFSNLRHLTQITLPASVTRIERYALSWPWNLTDVYYGGSQTQWEDVLVSNYNYKLFQARMHFGETPAAGPEVRGAEAVRSGGTLTVTADVVNAAGSRAVCALYGGGQLLDARTFAVTSARAEASFSFPGAAETVSVRIFLLDGAGAPLCAPTDVG